MKASMFFYRLEKQNKTKKMWPIHPVVTSSFARKRLELFKSNDAIWLFCPPFFLEKCSSTFFSKSSVQSAGLLGSWGLEPVYLNGTSPFKFKLPAIPFWRRTRLSNTDFLTIWPKRKKKLDPRLSFWDRGGRNPKLKGAPRAYVTRRGESMSPQLIRCHKLITPVFVLSYIYIYIYTSDVGNFASAFLQEGISSAEFSVLRKGSWTIPCAICIIYESHELGQIEMCENGYWIELDFETLLVHIFWVTNKKERGTLREQLDWLSTAQLSYPKAWQDAVAILQRQPRKLTSFIRRSTFLWTPWIYGSLSLYIYKEMCSPQSSAELDVGFGGRHENA